MNESNQDLRKKYNVLQIEKYEDQIKSLEKRNVDNAILVVFKTAVANFIIGATSAFPLPYEIIADIAILTTLFVENYSSISEIVNSISEKAKIKVNLEKFKENIVYQEEKGRRL